RGGGSSNLFAPSRASRARHRAFTPISGAAAMSDRKKKRGGRSYVQKNERRRQRYAEDPKYRKRTIAIANAWRTSNKDKINAERRLRRATDPEFRKQCAISDRRDNLKRRYGITIDDYNRLFKKQKGRCNICRKKSRRRRLYVDHDHRRKFVRQLLCNPCNIGLGWFKDDARLLRRAAPRLDAAPKAHGDGKRPHGSSKKGRGGRKPKR